MPPFGPIKRKNLIKALRRAGFEGPYSGGFLILTEVISVNTRARLLQQGGINKDEWEQL